WTACPGMGGRNQSEWVDGFARNCRPESRGIRINNQVSLSLVYYPPYHSKYNPIERVWAILENHWRGEVLNSVEKAMGLARTMKYNGKNPVVKLINGTYEKGIKLTNKAMNQIEKMIERMSGIEKWAVDIPCY
ncbi:Mobile element protein, partial [Olavius algarvensis Delta 1 endosymbiont]